MRPCSSKLPLVKRSVLKPRLLLRKDQVGMNDEELLEYHARRLFLDDKLGKESVLRLSGKVLPVIMKDG